MGVNAADIERMNRQGPDWRHPEDKKIINKGPDSEKPYDPWATDSPHMQQKMKEHDKREKQGQVPNYRPQARRPFLSGIVSTISNFLK